MIETDTVHVMDFQHPMKNLSPNGASRREPEAEFSDQFAASYREKFLQIHKGTNKSQTLFVREVPVASFGIADLLVLSWTNSPRKIKTIEDFIQLKPQTRAFEVKLSDWRNGLMQAHRYRYFSNVSILVLPTQKLRTAEKHIEFFKKIRIGLWGFEPSTETITRRYTPRPKHQMAAVQNEKVIATIAKNLLSQPG